MDKSTNSERASRMKSGKMGRKTVFPAATGLYNDGLRGIGKGNGRLATAWKKGNRDGERCADGAVPSWVPWVLNFVLLLTSIFLILLVLIQRGKGGGLAGASAARAAPAPSARGPATPSRA